MNYYDPIAAYLGEWSQTLKTGSVLLRIGIMVLLASVMVTSLPKEQVRGWAGS